MSVSSSPTDSNDIDRTRRVRRHARRALGWSLLVGVVVTLALAWIAPVLAAHVFSADALRSRELALAEPPIVLPSDPVTASASGRLAGSGRFFRYRGVTRVTRWRRVLDDLWVVHPAPPSLARLPDAKWPARFVVIWDESAPERTIAREAVFEPLSPSIALPRFRDDRWWCVETRLAGWPLRAFASEAWYPIENGVESTAAERRWGADLASDPRADGMFVPLRPLWPGLLGDVVFWGACCWIVVASLGAWRRARRRRAGRCVACGHPLAGATTCPECGERAGSARRGDRMIGTA